MCHPKGPATSVATTGASQGTAEQVASGVAALASSEWPMQVAGALGYAVVPSSFFSGSSSGWCSVIDAGVPFAWVTADEAFAPVPQRASPSRELLAWTSQI
ncbi:hypothetical protein GCM10009665_10530 [Kitasatospora nipponensis]|uniref:Uncharacterized protein n=1 Tax=Kitasatospora nipponensis TaxID=258049 RepID=A0ABP4GEI7_9ACTN